jgi:WD40 repeat protein
VTGSIDGTARAWEVPSGRLLATLAGHKEGLFRVAFTTDGETIATASDDKTVRLWNRATWREVGRLDHRAGVVTAGFTPDNETLVTTTLNGVLNIWRAPSFADLDAAETSLVLRQ